MLHLKELDSKIKDFFRLHFEVVESLDRRELLVLGVLGWLLELLSISIHKMNVRISNILITDKDS